MFIWHVTWITNSGLGLDGVCVAAYEAIKRASILDRQWRVIAQDRAPDLIDDVAGQVRHG